MREIDWRLILDAAMSEYCNMYLPSEGGEHPLKFDQFACMYYGIPRNIAQQFDAESII